MTRPFGTLNRSPSSIAVAPMMTFLSLSLCVAAGSPRSTSTIGDGGQGFRPDAEIDAQRRFAALVLAGEQRADRRQKLTVEHFAKRIAPHQPIRLDRDIDDRRPRLLVRIAATAG